MTVLMEDASTDLLSAAAYSMHLRQAFIHVTCCKLLNHIYIQVILKSCIQLDDVCMVQAGMYPDFSLNLYNNRHVITLLRPRGQRKLQDAA